MMKLVTLKITYGVARRKGQVNLEGPDGNIIVQKKKKKKRRKMNQMKITTLKVNVKGSLILVNCQKITKIRVKSQQLRESWKNQWL